MTLRHVLYGYLGGIAATAGALACVVPRVNGPDEWLMLVAFCVFWPLTWAYLVLAFAVLLALGWRGGPIW